VNRLNELAENKNFKESDPLILSTSPILFTFTKHEGNVRSKKINEQKKMQDEGCPEGFLDWNKAYDQDHNSGSDGNKQNTCPGPRPRDQKTYQYAPKNPGDDQCDG